MCQIPIINCKVAKVNATQDLKTEQRVDNHLMILRLRRKGNGQWVTDVDSHRLEVGNKETNHGYALDYYVSIESDIFVPTYKGHMAKLVEGHRRYLGFRKTILLDRKLLVELIDQYKNGTINWNQFSAEVKATHADRLGNPTARSVVPGKPKLEDYFYTNPQECTDLHGI
ncbi:hypothetical protein L6164_024729 [Bauhinia variegata]|uniref:Uncharacterized protein n=1 Tax=Bauhinia variegata TaxID=167791 RepID=A0ACB9LY57_BAUVA|nr:hypothetical protein L6164_024729 [Bauhinia variegata]